MLLTLLSASPVLAAAPLRLPLSDLAPWNYLDEGCRPAGIAVDLLNEIGRRSGVSIVFADVPYVENQAALLDGRLDADLNERNAWFDEHLEPFGPLFALDDVVIVRSDAADAGSGQRIGHLSTHNSRALVLQALDAEVIEFDDYASLAAAFRDGSVDAVAGLKEPLLFHLYRHGASAEVLRTLRTLQSVPVWLYLSPRVDAGLRERLRESIVSADFKSLLLKSRSLHLSLQRVRGLPDAAHCNGKQAEGNG